MNKKKLIIIKSNILEGDIRILKEIDVLDSIFKILFLGWNRDPIKKIHFSEKEITQQLFYLKAPHGKWIIIYIPIWWIFIFWKLLLIEWDVAHVFNFDSAIPVILVAKIKNKKVVYEVLDTYEDSLKIPEILRRILMKIDKFFLSISDGIILADSAQIEEFDGINNQNIITLFDSPPDKFDPNKYKVNSKFILFYAGALYKERKLNLNKIIEVMNEIDDIKLIIAGYGDLIPEIQEWEKKMPDKLEFIGKISYDEVMDYIMKCDLLFVIRDPSVRVYKYICGSTLLNAMMCGKPILVNNGVSSANIVNNEKCGLIIDGNNKEDIKKAILFLKTDTELLKLLGSNGRKAYEKKFDWKIMEKKLMSFYKNVIVNN